MTDHEKALKYLWSNIFADFPFRGVPSDANAFAGLSALLTVVGRRSIEGPVPAVVIDGDAHGIGKSLMANVIGAIVEKNTCLVRYPVSWRDGKVDDKAMARILTMYAVQESPVLAFDDVGGTVGGSVLENTVTAYPDVTVRLVGDHKLSAISWTTQVVFTGNNVRLTEEMSRRTLICRLEGGSARHRRPNLLGWVQDNRIEIVKACRTILDARVAYKSPIECGDWTPFEAWTKIIPSAIVLAGGPNILHARAWR